MACLDVELREPEYDDPNEDEETEEEIIYEEDEDLDDTGDPEEFPLEDERELPR